MAQLIHIGEVVTRGEQKTLDYLQGRLPNDWIIFGNPRISTPQLSRELDAIVLGNEYVWAIDEKGFGGQITGDEFVWILSDHSARERIINTVLHAASMVKGRLIAIESKLRNVWVEGLIVLSANDADVQVRDRRISRHVRKLMGCEDYFREARIPEARPFPSGLKEVIAKALSGKSCL